MLLQEIWAVLNRAACYCKTDFGHSKHTKSASCDDCIFTVLFASGFETLVIIVLGWFRPVAPLVHNAENRALIGRKHGAIRDRPIAHPIGMQSSHLRVLFPRKRFPTRHGDER